MKKIAILSHTFGNIGHTFMGIGVRKLFIALLNNVEITSFNSMTFSVSKVNPLYFWIKTFKFFKNF